MSTIILSDDNNNIIEYVERVNDIVIIKDNNGDTLLLEDYIPRETGSTPSNNYELILNKVSDLSNPNLTTYPNTIAVVNALSAITQYFITGGTNVGSGSTIYNGILDNSIQLKTLFGLGNINVVEYGDMIGISANTITEVNWGDINGSLSAQTDLYNILNLKIDDVPTGSSKYIRENGNWIEYVVDSMLSTGSTNPVENKAITKILNLILDVISEPPTYIQPTTTITNITQTVEYGSTLNNNITITFTQNDAGILTSYELFRNNTIYSNNQITNINETNIQSGITYYGKCCYNEGITKTNNLGIPDSTNKILAGCIDSISRTITPSLKYFWGASNTIPITSNDIRNLSNNMFANTSTITLSTGISYTNFIVAIPNNKHISTVIDTTNLNANITSNYLLTNNNFQVADASGNLKSYNLYVMTTAIPYNPSANHIITII